MYAGGIMRTNYRIKGKEKKRIRQEYNYTCQICGGYGYEVDHRIPWSISHDSNDSNLRVLCVRCNRATRLQRKDSLIPLDEWWEYIKRELTA